MLDRRLHFLLPLISPTWPHTVPLEPPESPVHLPGDRLWLMRRAAESASRPAVLSETATVTYAELLERSGRFARQLLGDRAELGGARVASMVAPGADWVTVQWAIWRAGGIAVPLAIGQPVPELAYVLRDSGAEAVVASAEFHEVVSAAAAEAGIPMRPFEAVADGAALASTSAESDAASRGALILYTSGTTGRPKGVLITHANLQAQVSALNEAWEWTPEDHVLLVLPLHHIHGIVNVVLCALANGARCSVRMPFDAARTWNRIADGDLTLFMAVPTVYQRMLAAWDAADAETQRRWSDGARRLRLCVSGSAALPVRVLEHWERITGHRLLERYGMTEIGMGLTNPLRGERRPGHVGQPFPRVQVRLVDDEGREVAPGSIGEVQIKSPNVFPEYWNRPEETRAAFTEDGWFRTGDVGVVEEGSYRLLGRSSVDILKTGGEKVSALEVEETLREHPAVADCAVVGVADESWGDRICVAVVARPGAEIAPEDLKTWAKERLSPWKVPKEIRCVDALPRNIMGKVDKKAVRADFAAR